ncbi:MAG: PadR family transcriptional regulator [Thermoplasmata archaeon]
MQKRVPTELISYLVMKTFDKEGTTYGYELINELKDISKGHWDPSYGTIYGALNRMEKKTFIERVEGDMEDRKYYRLTAKGKRELDKKEEEMKEIGEMARENVLGFLSVYREIYGEDKFQELMERVKEEFDL